MAKKMADEAGAVQPLGLADDATLALSGKGDPPPSAAKANDLEALRKVVEDAASASGNLGCPIRVRCSIC